MTRLSRSFGKDTIIFETGKVAKKSDGAIWVQYGDTIVLVTVVVSTSAREEVNFVPLLVDYRERTYAAGKIPGGFFKREGAPGTQEILAGRLIDRSIRPLFPDGFRNETQVVATVLSASESNQPGVLGILGASLSLAIANLSFAKLIGAVRVGRVKDNFIINPTDEELKESQIDLVVAGDKEGIFMVEGETNKVEESVILETLRQAQSAIRELISLEEEFISLVSIDSERHFSICDPTEEIEKEVKDRIWERVKAIESSWGKEKKEAYLEKVKQDFLEEFLPNEPQKEQGLLAILEKMKKKKMRELVLLEGKRWNGRVPDEIRSIECEVGILPRVHGSGLFTRGGTQSLTVVTLGSSADKQVVKGLHKEEISKHFMFHYNFLPFCTGEVKFLRAPARREIGHGFLAEKAILPVLPATDSFPYTIRLVSDVLESNGSSSMASVCGGSLSLMDAGVPISETVAGVGIGLISDQDKFVILTDIEGLEDYLGDMDFKVAGTWDKITALQLDIKISGVSLEIIEEALAKARKARQFIIGEMNRVIERPREFLSPHAPHIVTTAVPQDKIGVIIGPGGRVIKKIIQDTGADIDIDDVEELVTISSMDEESTNRALEIVKSIIQEPKVGDIYSGTVKKVTDFGAFVEIAPGREGLVHVSELSEHFVKNVSDVIKVGDKIRVKLINVDDLGRLSLSKRKAESKSDSKDDSSRERGGRSRARDDRK